MLAELHVFYEAAYEGMMACRTKDVMPQGFDVLFTT